MNAGVINCSLTIRAHNPCYGKSAGALMDWRFLEGWWEEVKSGLRGAIVRDREAEFERARRERDADQKRKREEDYRADRLLTILILSEDLQRSARVTRQCFGKVTQAITFAERFGAWRRPVPATL